MHLCYPFELCYSKCQFSTDRIKQRSISFATCSSAQVGMSQMSHHFQVISSYLRCSDKSYLIQDLSKSYVCEHLLQLFTTFLNFSVARAGRLKGRPDLGDSELSVRYSNQEFSVEHLPPIVVEFLLPKNYPSVNPPLFRIQADWLNKTQAIFTG